MSETIRHWGCVGYWVETVVTVHCGTVLGDKFDAMMKMRPPKRSHNVLDTYLDPVPRVTSKWRILALFFPSSLMTRGPYFPNFDTGCTSGDNSLYISLPSKSKKDKMANGTPRGFCVSHHPPPPLLWGRFLRGGDGSFQVVWRTDLEVDLTWTQNYCVELLALYLRRMIIEIQYSDEVVNQRGSCRNNAVPQSPREKL